MPTTRGPQVRTIPGGWALLCAVLLIAAAGAQAAPAARLPGPVELTSVGIAQSASKLVLHVTLSGPARIETLTLAGPPRFVADFPGVLLPPGQARTLPAQGGVVERIEVLQRDDAPATVRIVAALRQPVEAVVRRFVDGCGVEIELPLAPATAAEEKAGPGADPTPQLRDRPLLITGAAGGAATAEAAEALRVVEESQPPPGEPSSPAPAASPAVDLPADPTPAGHAVAQAAALVGAELLPTMSAWVTLPDFGLSAVASTVAPDSTESARDSAAAPAAESSVWISGEQETDNAPAGAALVEAIDQVLGDDLKVVIRSSAPIRYTSEKATEPEAYVLTLQDTRLADDFPRFLICQSPLVKLITADSQAGTTRVNLVLGGPSLCSAYVSPDERELTARVAALPAAELAPVPSLNEALAAQQGGDLGRGLDPADPVHQARVDVDFQDANLVEILTALARFAKRNIIAMPSVTGIMTMHLTDTPLYEALTLVTRLNNYDTILVGAATYVIGTPEEIDRIRSGGAAEGPGLGPGGAGETPGAPLPRVWRYTPRATTPMRLVRKLEDLGLLAPLKITTSIDRDAKSVVFMNLPDEAAEAWLRQQCEQADLAPAVPEREYQLKYLTPEQAVALLRAFVPAAQVVPDTVGTGKWVQLQGQAADVDEAERILAAADVDQGVQPPAAEPTVVEYVDLDWLDAKAAEQFVNSAYGSDSAVTVTALQPGGQGGGGTQASAQAGTLPVGGTIALSGPESAVAQIRRALVALDRPEPQVEITATITDLSVDNTKSVGIQWQLPGFEFQEVSTDPSGWKFGKIIRSPLNPQGSGSFLGTFKAEEVVQNATVLARPTVCAFNRTTARILIGERYPYEVTKIGLEGTATRSVEFQEVGVGIEFTPSVASDGSVTLFLAPQVSLFTGYTPQGYPIVSTRETSNIVRVFDGEVVVIGGLLRDEDVKTVSGIPLLKEIPVLGELFKQRSKRTRKSEVVVFAQIRIVQPDEGLPAGPAPEEARLG